MSFYPQCAEYGAMPLDAMSAAVTGGDVRRALAGECRSPGDLLALLSPAAALYLEEMAGRASRLTLQHFGRTIQLFTPLYLSNHCANHCVYCGFNAANAIPRSHLSLEQVEAEARAIAATGLRQLLILTGESRTKASPEYLEACLGVLRRHFPSVFMEIYAMEQDEYGRMIRAGIDGLTLFQETYDESLYARLHPHGPKRDYRFRLDAPERACRAGMRVVNIGALLGLGDWRKDALLTGLHAAYLQRRYPQADIAVSLPRMRPHAGGFQPASIVSDADLVQIMLALRLFLPRLGITISTRETARLRDNLLPLGVTRMSAGVSTAVGGHSQESETEGGAVGQFEISDDRSVEEMCAMLRAHGFQPVFADWHPPVNGAAIPAPRAGGLV
ncbi:2-iminoacetate synthase ThiH [Pseudodesulfovibrio sp. F-1]|uniref:2-iminoacetate synthase ThiH n=1 Tax=Pseudodesulfovibrio alkaliphilus TaxID=2661613 RepID=A0A7K1KLB5_9BACT|nr:2-iminoacetate synthase ThiH [Pseudodesulfovibrio alkaliphilus]